jgi:hypothetical protein
MSKKTAKKDTIHREPPLPGIESNLSQREQLAMISRIPAHELHDELVVTNYQPDRAIREAVLAQPDDWKLEVDGLSYVASNQLLVYLGDQRNPLPVEEALSTIREFSASTVITARIALAFWHKRRYEQHLAKNGAAAMRVDEILAMRGFKKRSMPAYPGSDSDTRYTIGYRLEDKQAILLDLHLLQRCYVRGECTVMVAGKWQQFSVDDAYLRYSVVYRKTGRGREMTGLFVTAGDWINVYEEQGAYFLAAVEQKVFQLNPHDEQHELRIALYLTERWREQARKGNYDEPISMQGLLDESVIPIDRKHAYRFIPRIEDAMHQLFVKGILGAEPVCLTPPNREVPRWTAAWLASLWVLLPPTEITRRYRTLHSTMATPLLADPEAKDIR